MEFPVNRRQTSPVNVSINFSSSDIGVAEQFLYCPQIGTIGKQMTGETVPQGMRMDIFGDPGLESCIFDYRPDPLPVEFARKRGCDKIITILTREKEYVKSAERDVEFSAFAYRRHKNFASALKNRSDVYNKSKEMLAELEKNGSAFTFAPLSTIGWSRTEKDTSKLKAMYDEGYNDAVRRMDELKKFLEN